MCNQNVINKLGLFALWAYGFGLTSPRKYEYEVSKGVSKLIKVCRRLKIGQAHHNKNG